jgi:hypothetical protein
MLLDWIAPPECPTEQAVVAQVTTLVGEPLAAQSLVVRARIERGATRRFRLDLRIGANEGSTRSLESDDCGELAQATALIVSFDLQSRAKAEQQKGLPPVGDAVPPPPTTATKPEPRRPEPDARRAKPDRAVPAEPPRPRTTAARFGIGAEGFVDAGSLPTGAWGAGIMAFVSQGRFRGELGAALWPRSQTLAKSEPGAGASVHLRTLGLRTCLTALSALHIDACLHAEGGIARATGFGISRPSASNGRWFAAFVGATARPFSWGGLVPRFTVELGAPVHYAEVIIEGVGPVHTPSPVVFRFGVGVESKLF